MEEQVDEVLIENHKLYTKGTMTEENFVAFLNCLCMAFGTEYIASRMMALGI